MEDEKETLHRYLRAQRASLLSKLDGLDEYGIRRPMTGTGTNLLGLVKHVASVEVGYFGEVFDRPSDIELPWFDDGAPANADLWATADETRAQIVELHHRCAAHSDATIEALPLDAVGTVPWWGDRSAASRSTRCSSTCASRPPGTPVTPTSCASSLDGAVGSRADDPNIPAARLGGLRGRSSRRPRVARIRRATRRLRRRDYSRFARIVDTHRRSTTCQSTLPTTTASRSSRP